MLPNPGQEVGVPDLPCPGNIAKSIVDTLKTGDIAGYHLKLSQNKIAPRQVIDSSCFSQNLIFAATFIKNEDLAIKVMTELIKQGVDVMQPDSLKQTPLYYSAREGKAKVTKFLID